MKERMKELIGFDLSKNNIAIIKPELGKEIFSKYKPKEQPQKNINDWLIEFLYRPEVFEKLNRILDKYFEKSLPTNIKENCANCNGEKKHITVMGNCEKYKLQKYLTFVFAASEFVNIVLTNKFIYEDKKILFELTKQFYRCFHFVKGRGVMLFDLDYMVRYCLDANMDAIAEVFKNSNSLQNIETSNETLNYLNKELRKDKIFHRKDLDFKTLQQQFFKDQIEIYKNERFIEKEREKEINSKKENDYSFINLFKSKELYNKAIKVLKNNDFITENNGVLNWIFTETKEYKTSQTLIALCVVLEIKQYLKPSPKAVYNYIEKEFNIIIDKGFYSRSSNGFKRDYDIKNTKNSSYTSLFKDIL